MFAANALGRYNVDERRVQKLGSRFGFRIRRSIEGSPVRSATVLAGFDCGGPGLALISERQF